MAPKDVNDIAIIRLIEINPPIATQRADLRSFFTEVVIQSKTIGPGLAVNTKTASV